MSELATEMSKLVDLSRSSTTEQEATAYRRQAFELFLDANPTKRLLIPNATPVILYEDEVDLWNKSLKA